MEQLSVPVLRQLARIRGLLPTERAGKQQILTLLSNNAGPGPFGISLDIPLYQAVLQLRLIPRYLLIRHLAQQGKLIDQASDISAVIQAVLEVDRFDMASEDALKYFTFPIHQLQLLTGTTDVDRVELIIKLFDARGTGFSAAAAAIGVASPISLEVSRLGVTTVPVVPRPLIPLERDPKTLSSAELASAVTQGYDLSGLLPPPQPVSLGLVQSLNQALISLGIKNVGGVIGTRQVLSLTDRYRALAKELQRYSKYPVAVWWVGARDYINGLYPNQRKLVAEELGLVKATEAVDDTEVVFRLSHGGAVGPDQPPNSRVQDLIEQRPTSRMLPLLKMLASLEATKLRTIAARYGMYLPVKDPHEALYRTIFLYEWLEPNRPVLAVALTAANTPAELLTILRKYDDFELRSVWPGFAASIGADRRQLLHQLLGELQKPHEALFAGCGGTPGYGLYAPFQLFGCGIPTERDAWTRSQLVQLSRALHRTAAATADPGALAVEEDNIIANLMTAVLAGAGGDPDHPDHPDTQKVRALLELFLEIGMLGLGWDGQSRFPLSATPDGPNSTFIEYAQKALDVSDVALISPTYAAYIFDDDAMPLATIRTLPQLIYMIASASVDEVVEHSIEIVQTAYIYLLLWFQQRTTDCNPFVFA